MDTYTAAGIAIQCAGSNFNRSLHYSGEGIAQISDMQAETEWGEPIYDYDFRGKIIYEKENGSIKLDKNGNPIPNLRGFGLRLRCPDGELEKVLNQNNTKNAVVLMKRELQLVTNECKNCTSTDIYIAAALAQNGPGFHLMNMRGIPNLSIKRSLLYGNPDVSKDWFSYFEADAQDHDMVNTKTQLNRFILVVNELRKRRWIVPDIDSTTIDTLKNWQE
jgi:hypothetical protein